MMERREILAFAVVLLIVIGLPAAALGYQYWLRPALSSTRMIDIRAAAPEAGGFQPDAIQVKAGETVTLRFSSTDVTHGIAIGPGLGIDLGHVDPGQVKEITLTFDHAGTYTFYCNSWCSPDHWRMRGVVQVDDPANPGALPTSQRDPVIEALIAEEVDIDDNVHTGDHPLPTIPLDRSPSAARGEALILAVNVPAELQDVSWRRSHSPADALDLLTTANPGVKRAELADVVAYLWSGGLSAEQITAAQTLYNKNCAACHGETGAGDGPVASSTANNPVIFADAGYMFTRRDDVLYAKIRRGGMGTDMPNFGTLFTQDETWALVNYLRSFSGTEQGPLGDAH
ncbi:MAG: c-type cytochrome [Chloroflexi bacterium]|nr:c-type cytochrome [Chloroflexota bacterium]